ncbi:hypothetical protein AY599_27640 [Leptolyngbya valderiana BDU 20041]|nr:hypothetical protein AY599_27640 [Leptolyngbya valderiana BDU 20041]
MAPEDRSTAPEARNAGRALRARMAQNRSFAPGHRIGAPEARNAEPALRAPGAAMDAARAGEARENADSGRIFAPKDAPGANIPTSRSRERADRMRTDARTPPARWPRRPPRRGAGMSPRVEPRGEAAGAEPVETVSDTSPAPAGRRDLRKDDFHGLRCAPPVATDLRPCGARIAASRSREIAAITMAVAMINAWNRMAVGLGLEPARR